MSIRQHQEMAITNPGELRQLLVGRVCKAVVVQRYWYNSALQDGASVLFIQLDENTWARLWFDVPEVFVGEVESPDCPDDHEMPPGCFCDLKEFERAAPILGCVIEGVELTDIGDDAQELAIQFAGRSRLTYRGLIESSELTVDHPPMK